MPRIVFTPNIQRHVLCPEATAPGHTVREVLDKILAENAQARSLVRVQEDAKRTKARLAELEKSEARLNNFIASFEAERRRASGRSGTLALGPSSIRTTDIGRLDWPVNGAFLYRFGRFVNPNNTTTRWNGIGITSSSAAATSGSAHKTALGYAIAGSLGITVFNGQAVNPSDVLVRRLDADFADPLELNARSRLGVPGLVQAVRDGTVVIANSLGSGVVEARALLSFLPALAPAVDDYGNGSAADTQNRTEVKASSAAGSRASIANNAGTEKNTVGRWRRSVSRIGSGLVGPRIKTLVAPNQNGNDKPLPSP